MSYKEFVAWCAERECDGCWGLVTAIYCGSVMDRINKLPSWRRNKEWKCYYEEDIVNEIVNPINEKIKEVYGS